MRGYTMPKLFGKSESPATDEPADVPASEAAVEAYSPLSFTVSSPANTIYGSDNVVAESAADNG